MTGVTEFKEEYDFDFQGNQKKNTAERKIPTLSCNCSCRIRLSADFICISNKYIQYNVKEYAISYFHVSSKKFD